MGKHRKRNGNRKRRRGRAPPTADLRRRRASHPLGVYGHDWDENYAFIAGFTESGFPYGTPWHEADWLLDDPVFGDWVREAREEAAHLHELYGKPNGPPF